MVEQAKVKQRSGTTTQERTDATTEVSKVGVFTIAAFGTLVGLWSVACLIGGMAASGGPLELVGNWFKAVTGM
ncbi:MAG: hypothetical protein D6B25_09965 [Desulfobulbaceae bacterium]|nr:MAG: hypothetical protein D6B25_09965 [Desulfobulbaceae bacterium]